MQWNSGFCSVINKKEGLEEGDCPEERRKETKSLSSLAPCSLSCKFAGSEIDLPVRRPESRSSSYPSLRTDCVFASLSVRPTDRPTDRQSQKERRRPQSHSVGWAPFVPSSLPSVPCPNSVPHSRFLVRSLLRSFVPQTLLSLSLSLSLSLRCTMVPLPPPPPPSLLSHPRERERGRSASAPPIMQRVCRQQR